MKRAIAAILSAVISFSAAVPSFAAMYEAPKSSVNVMTDPQRITDEEFFGVWDGNAWVGGDPILRYDAYEKLGKVEELAKSVTDGDYSAAKEELLRYYRDYRDIPNMESEANLTGGITPVGRAAMNSIMAVGGLDNEVEVDDQWAWRQLKVGSRGAYTLMALDKTDYDILIASREGGMETAPFLDIQTSKTSYRVYATGDTYIRAGVNRLNNYGAEELLKIHEEGMPISDFTKRTYIYFDLSQYDLSGLKSVTLNVYAKTDKEGAKARITATGDSKFEEMELNWNTNTLNKFSYQDPYFGRLDVYDWTEPANAMSEWINGMSRMGDVATLAAEFERTGDEHFAELALNYLMSYYHYRQPFAPRICDSAWRTPYFIQPFFTLLESETMTPELFVAYLKLINYTGLLAITSNIANNNRGTVLLDSAFTIGSYFPEIVTDEFWETANEKAEKLFGSVIYPNFGGYAEASVGGYPSMVLDNMLKIIKQTSEIKHDEVPEYLYNQCDNLGTYLVNVSFPDGLCAPYGDNSTSNHRSLMKQVSDYTGNEHLRYFGTGGSAGKQLYPSSALSEKNKVWMMKTDLVNKNALALFGNAENALGHRHSDDLSVDVYGYGHLLLREAGNREYDSGTDKAVLPTLTENHNTVTVDKQNQKQNCGAGINTWISNNTVDYVDAYTNGYANFSSSLKYLHTRKVLFLKDLSFWVVSDILQDKGSKGAHDFYQTWSPNLNAFPTIDETTKTMTTHYESGGNIQVVPADPEQLTWDNGEPFSKTCIEQTYSEKLMYKKEQVTGDVTFDTVLYPTPQGADTSNPVTVERIPMDGITTAQATALKINVSDKQTAYYYNAHDKSGEERVFGKYSSDGEVAFVNEKNGKISNVSGSYVSTIKDTQSGKDIFKSDGKLQDVSVSITGQIVNLETSEDVKYVGFRIYAPNGVNTFNINGQPAEYTIDGDYIVKEATPIPSSGKFKIGDYITMGSYDGKDIVWRAVDVDDEYGTLLVSDIGLTKREFDAAGSSTDGSHSRGTERTTKGSDFWADSNLRDWLNSDSQTVDYSCGNKPSYANEAGFLTNFNEQEKAAIKTVNLKTLINEADKEFADGGSAAYIYSMSDTFAGSLIGANYDSAYYDITEDKMFIPDITMIEDMYANRRWLGDDYYMTRDAGGNKAISYVRTPLADKASGSGMRVTINYQGADQVRDTGKTSDKWMIRPAFYIDDDNFNIVSGNGSKRQPYSMEEAPAKSLMIGDYVTLGEYGGKDILWRVAGGDENGMMLITDKILTTREYDAAGNAASGSHGRDNDVAGKTRKEKGSSYWSDSNIRDWLNSADTKVKYTCGNEPSYKDEPGFLTGFTEQEISAIKEPNMKDILSPLDKELKDGGSEDHKWATNDVPTAYSNYDSAWYELVNDKVFIPDIRQIATVYNNGDILGSDYYIGRLSSNNEQLYTWLRTPMQEEKNGQSMRIVRKDGTVHSSAANETVVGVRPAVYIDERWLDLDSHDGTSSDPYVVSAEAPSETPTPTSTPTPTATPEPTATPTPTATPEPTPTIPPEEQTIDMGDYISIGQDNGNNILWRVVEDGENGPLVIADKILSTTMAFDKDGSNYWPESDICTWLNGDFYNNAFTDAEKTLIVAKEHKNIITSGHIKDGKPSDGGVSDYPWTSVNISGAFNESDYDNAYYVMGNEKIFLPDIKQLYDMQVTNQSVLGDNYAGAKDAGGNFTYTWTRMPMTNKSNPGSTTQMHLTTNKADGFGNGLANAGAFGIRPMMYLNTDIKVNSGSGTATNPFTIK